MNGWVQEVTELHAFFEAWLSGGAAVERLERLERVLDDGFTMVAPGGAVVSRADLLDRLRSARGQRPGLRITVDGFHTLHEGDAHVLARYAEHQTVDGERRSRIGTVFFAVDASCPNGLRWVSVHETWTD